MAINIKVNEPTDAPKEIKIKVSEPTKAEPQLSMELKARRTLDGNVMIFDHKEIDIVLMPSKKKILAFAKDRMNDEVYEAQERLFHFLRRKGVIELESVQGGTVYSSMEAKIAESKDYNPFQVALFSVGKFIEEERPYFEYETAYEDAEEKRLTEPGPEDSTDFDPERHATSKGSLRPGVRPYGIAAVYRI